eukprot:GHUV01007738.1.p1 GENE.GHUV01007738.1~~GHUV01007738.1.p1  ORF type:complete len:310 (+),score=66.11 GHUV01007738.1:99-1028(+)
MLHWLSYFCKQTKRHRTAGVLDDNARRRERNAGEVIRSYCKRQLQGTTQAMKRKCPDEMQLKVLLHNEPEPITADLRLIQTFSSVVSELPVNDTPVWDLSNLLIENQPVNRSTVVSWLNRAYKLVYAAEYEAVKPESAKSCTITEAVLLLSFADAVGSTDGLIQAVASHIAALPLLVRVKVEGTIINLRVKAGGYYWTASRNAATPAALNLDYELVAELTNTGKQLLQGFVAPVAEQLLYVTKKLGLVQLQSRVEKAFLQKSQQAYAEPFLSASTLSSVVYSPRVLDVMQYTPEEGKKAWIRQLLKRDD